MALEAMELALDLARIAGDLGEVPVGAVVIDAEGTVVGRGHNLRERGHDPTAHAEVVALREAGSALGTWQLTGCTLGVTLDP
jgi:tRNA(adenine34) deaminase